MQYSHGCFSAFCRCGVVSHILLVSKVSKRCLLLLAIFVLLSPSAFGQSSDEEESSVMPGGWQGMSAGDFVSAADALFAAKPAATKEHQTQVVTHAWNTFLTDDQFVNDADWQTVESLTGIITRRKGMLVTGETDEERATSQQQADQQLEVLRDRIKQRLQSEPDLVNGSAYADLKQTSSHLSKGILNKSERSKLFGDWMDANDWDSLPLTDQLDLLGRMDVDQVDAKKFSARWTGSLQAPASEQYIFEQLRQYEADGAMKVWIDGNRVLDSSDQEGGEKMYRSQPVALQAGQSVPVKIELVFDRDSMTKSNSVYGNRRFPLALLMWESESVEQQVIPAAAFTPPAGFAAEGAAGLKGEYFTDLEFGGESVTRLDPGLQMVWRGTAVCSLYEQKQSEVVGSCLRSITRSAGLAELESEEQVRVVKEMLPRLGNRVSCAQRVELVEYLSSQTDLLADLKPDAINNLLGFTYMLPIQSHLELLGKWGELRDVAVCRAGKYPSWGWGYYNTFNHSALGSIGHLFWGPQEDDAQWLQENYLAKKDGSCNLTVAYTLAFSARFGNWEVKYTNHLDEILADETLIGDRRAGWLLARAFAAEIAITEAPRPSYALPFLEEAYLAAESNEMKFRAFQEQVNRLISLDQGEEAKTELLSLAKIFLMPNSRR